MNLPKMICVRIALNLLLKLLLLLLVLLLLLLRLLIFPLLLLFYPGLHCARPLGFEERHYSRSLDVRMFYN